MGFGHAIENIGGDPVEAILAFNSGKYQEISLSTLIASTPKYVLETNFGLPEPVINSLPYADTFFADPKM